MPFKLFKKKKDKRREASKKEKAVIPSSTDASGSTGTRDASAVSQDASKSGNNEDARTLNRGVDGNEVAKKLTMVQLNDVIPSSQGNGHGNRGRFASYASGASSPSTSSGNLSWNGDSNSDGKAKEEESKIVDTFEPLSGGGTSGGTSGASGDDK